MSNLKKLFELKKKLLEKKKRLLGDERNGLEYERQLLKNEALENSTIQKSKKSYMPLNNNLSGGEGLLQTIKNVLNSSYFIFIKNYLYFIIIFTICFYTLIYISNTTKNNIIQIETKIFIYLLIIFLFVVINDIISSPQEDLTKFIIIILFSLLIIYVSFYIIDKYYSNEGYLSRIYKILGISIIVFIIFTIIIYFQFQQKDANKAYNLYQTFNIGINKNYYFMLFVTLYIFIYKIIDYYTNWNSNLSDILSPTILGGFLLFFIFCILIFMSLKMKIINNKQILNSLLAFLGITIFLGFVYLFIFMKSLNTICTDKTDNQNGDEKNDSKKEIIINLIIISLIIILWLDDSRNWHQMGSLLFIFATIITFLGMFYYSRLYPSTSLLSFWLFIEWIIIIFRRRENSKNSIHYSFMKT